MATQILILIYIFIHFFFTLNPSTAISYCNGPCTTLNDCYGQLICINGKCNDDPQVGTHICSAASPPPPSVRASPPPPSSRSSPPPPSSRASPPPPSGGGSTCQPYGTLTCNGVSYPKYSCSPPVTTVTDAKLTLNDFSPGGDGGDPSECDGQFHDNSESIVALSTGWYAGGSRCLKTIRITAQNGRSTTAKVVDECDSTAGCDSEHAYQPPCRNNIVDGSDAVWKALGLDENLGVVDITWSMVS